jgi:hypothetical protein
MSSITGNWMMTVDKNDLIAALTSTHLRLSRKRRIDGRLNKNVIMAACDTGLSVRTHNRGMDIAAEGIWTSPIIANGVALQRLAPKLAGDTVELSYCDGQLALNRTRVPAREA